MLISEWSCNDVKKWLISEGFKDYADALCETHGVDGEVLLTLTEKDLRSPPLQIQKLAHIKKLGKCLKIIQQKSSIEQKKFQRQLTHSGSEEDDPQLNQNSISKVRLRQHALQRYSKLDPNSISAEKKDDISSDWDDGDVHFFVDADGKERCGTLINRKGTFLPEYKKLLVSFLYSVFAGWVSAFAMVVVHERVPDKKKYPPLPDIFLDNIPLIPYAFKLTELCGLLLFSLLVVILIFHKHRSILLRRFFSIASTVFLLRSVTMFVTSLSVPGEHLECKAAGTSGWQRIARATQIVGGFGMTLTGVHTCGDYMFSGHTAYLTIFNHLVTEYTPPRMYYLHTASWVLYLFGVFFILAAHEHYSIDVLIAFYITSRIFLYYHMLANTRSYWHSKRIRIWFPLLSYFECNVPGKVPNEFEWPITYSKLCAGVKNVRSSLKLF